MQYFVKYILGSFILFQLFVSGALYAQLPEIPIPIPKFEYDTNYIVKFDNLLAIRFVVPRRTYNFRIKNQTSNDEVVYRANLQTAFGLGITYRWLAFDVVFNPKWNRRRTEELGETDEFNIKGTIYLKRHLIEGAFRTYEGMYVANPADYLNPWDGKYPYRPDLNNTNLSFSYVIPFNTDQYSPRSTFLLDGRMKQSAGSFMLMSSVSIATMSADSSIIPLEYETSFDPKAQINRLGFLMLQQYFGYAYTFIYKKYFATVSFLPGAVYSYGTVYSEGGTYHPSTLDFTLETKNSIGYNSRRWYMGAYIIYKYQNIPLTDNVAFSSSLGEIRFFVGYRIKAPYVVNQLVPK